MDVSCEIVKFGEIVRQRRSDVFSHQIAELTYCV
jgi:hypothetical protein